MLQCTCKQKIVIIEGVSFIATLSTPARLHRKPASAETSCDGWGAQDNPKRNTLYSIESLFHQVSLYYLMKYDCLTDGLTYYMEQHTS